MNPTDRARIIAAVDYWIKTKLDQEQVSLAAGKAQGGTRAQVTGGKHLAGINALLLDELQLLGLSGLTHALNRQATVPGYYRAAKSWDLLVLRHGQPLLALEYKSMTGSEGKNLNNRADEVIGAALDLKRAQEEGLLPHGMKRGYVFLMEVTPAVTVPVGVNVRVGTPDPAFKGASYLKRMGLLCERLRDDAVYDMAWALGVTRTPPDFIEPLPSVGWDRFKADLAEAFA